MESVSCSCLVPKAAYQKKVASKNVPMSSIERSDKSDFVVGGPAIKDQVVFSRTPNRNDKSPFNSFSRAMATGLSRPLLKASAPVRLLRAGPMHRAFQRLHQFVFFNVIAAPVAFQKKVEFPGVARLPAFEGDVIYILHRVAPDSSKMKKRLHGGG